MKNTISVEMFLAHHISQNLTKHLNFLKTVLTQAKNISASPLYNLINNLLLKINITNCFRLISILSLKNMVYKCWKELFKSWFSVICIVKSCFLLYHETHYLFSEIYLFLILSIVIVPTVIKYICFIYMI